MYTPAEDSFLLADCLKSVLKTKDKEIKILEMGSGSGFISEEIKKLGFKDILCADLDKEAISLLKEKKFKTIHTNLFDKIHRKSKFDLIVFNPPYLPEHKYDKMPDTTGGKHGYETIVKFLEQAKKHLYPKAEIILLFSSFSKPKIIKQEAKKLGYQYKFLCEKRFSYEDLFVYKLY